MYYLKLLAGACIGVGIGWLSIHLNGLAVKSNVYLNNRWRSMAILLIKLVLYFIALIGASFVGVELMLSIAISMVISMVVIEIWRFTRD